MEFGKAISLSDQEKEQYKALLERLEVSIISFKDIIKETETLRIDSNYYLKEYLKVENKIKNNTDYFIRLQDIQPLQPDGSAFYPALEPYYHIGDFPFLRVGDIKESKVDFDDCIKVPFNIYPYFPTLKQVKKGDIVLTKGGTVGKAGLITQSAFVSRDLIFINSSVLSEEDYIALFLYFKTDFAYKQLIRSSSQSVQPHLTITLVKNIFIKDINESLKKKLSVVYKSSQQKLEESTTLYQEAENILLEALGLKNFEFEQPTFEVQGKTFAINANVRTAQDFFKADRLDAEYYQKNYEVIENKIKNYKGGFARIRDVFSQNKFTFSKNDKEGFNYIEIGDISVSDGKASYNYVLTPDLPDNAKIKVSYGDLLISKVRPNRGAVAIIDFEKEDLVCSGAFTVLREKLGAILKKETLQVFLRANIFKNLLLKYNTGTSYPVIKDEDILELEIPLLDIETQNEIAEKIQESFALRKESERLLALAKEAVEVAIEQDEIAGASLLNNHL